MIIHRLNVLENKTLRIVQMNKSTLMRRDGACGDGNRTQNFGQRSRRDRARYLDIDWKKALRFISK
ncbi:hypothetical protein L798_15662 [Zootermopsis nevadensis]|uniref:Uncharacterized protein n=1 Tax=Zootermopsis nevadensis TaxID=136037 RepID=A0A067QUR5_ZOONE|nr:hypothetical protein L798_15662 [Zootermopsis nevadensis]